MQCELLTGVKLSFFTEQGETEMPRENVEQHMSRIWEKCAIYHDNAIRTREQCKLDASALRARMARVRAGTVGRLPSDGHMVSSSLRPFPFACTDIR